MKRLVALCCLATLPAAAAYSIALAHADAERWLRWTSGRFGAPYKLRTLLRARRRQPKLGAPAIDPSAFRMRKVIDLSNARLRKLAAALGPLCA